MTECRPNCDVFKAVQKTGLRYHWFCAKCGRDVSLEYIMLYDAMEGAK